MQLLKDPHTPFPDPCQADAKGLVALGGDLSVERLLNAYGSGIFPWSIQPITWWSPDPRGIFELDRFHVSKSLARALREEPFQITRDRAFAEVIAGCAELDRKRRDTWISPEFVEAYQRLHAAGHAHSVECWQEGKLVGGVYGVVVGGLFAGESMFHRASNASKIALHHLVEHLRGCGFKLFDIQMVTSITEQLGAIAIPRANYLDRLARAIEEPCRF